MVAILGWIIPEPLATPPTVIVWPVDATKDTAVSLGWVSVVIMARASSGPPSELSAIASTPERISDMGSSTPMTPVLHTSTSSAVSPSLPAASRVISSASLYPCAPTQVLAMPAFTMRARPRPVATRSRSRSTVAERMAEVVNTPPMAHGVSDARIARSSLSSPRVFKPMKTPPAEKPRADVMVPLGMGVISALAVIGTPS